MNVKIRYTRFRGGQGDECFDRDPGEARDGPRNPGENGALERGYRGFLSGAICGPLRGGDAGRRADPSGRPSSDTRGFNFWGLGSPNVGITMV